MGVLGVAGAAKCVFIFVISEISRKVLMVCGQYIIGR